MPWPKPSEARRCSSGSPSSRRTTSRKQHELMYVSSARLWTEGRWGWAERVCARLVARRARPVGARPAARLAARSRVVVGPWGGGPRPGAAKGQQRCHAAGGAARAFCEANGPAAAPCGAAAGLFPQGAHVAATHRTTRARALAEQRSAAAPVAAASRSAKQQRWVAARAASVGRRKAGEGVGDEAGAGHEQEGEGDRVRVGVARQLLGRVAAAGGVRGGKLQQARAEPPRRRRHRPSDEAHRRGAPRRAAFSGRRALWRRGERGRSLQRAGGRGAVLRLGRGGGSAGGGRGAAGGSGRAGGGGGGGRGEAGRRPGRGGGWSPTRAWRSR